MTAAPPEPSPACRAVLVRVADGLMPHRQDMATTMAEAIHAAVDELRDDLLEATVAVCRANVDLAVAGIRDGTDPATLRPPEEAVAYTREIVHRGLPLEVLLGAYRVGHKTFWQLGFEALVRAGADPAVQAEATEYSSDWTFAFVDALTAPLTRAFLAERQSWAQSAARQRAEQVAAIVEGEDVDERRASQRLRYELSLRHLAFVLWVEETGAADETYAYLVELAGAVGEALGSARPLVVAAGPLVHGWVAVEAEVDPLAATESLTPALRDARARVAFGTPGLGIEGFRRSRAEALSARRMALLARTPAGSRGRFDEVALTALLTNDLDEARRFVAHELGPLAAETEPTRRLATTLRVFLEERGSFVRAAARLFVHEKTVAYRVKRATELLGRPVTENAPHLQVALLLHESLREDAPVGRPGP